MVFCDLLLAKGSLTNNIVTMLVPSMNLLFFWNSPVNFTIHFRYVQCWYFSGVFCDSESSGNFVMEVHEYVNVYESFYISADISAHTDYIWSPGLSTYADKLSIYMGTSQQWWGPIYWLEPSSKLFLKLQHSLHSQLWLSRRHWEMCAVDSWGFVYAMNEYVPHAL